MLLQPSIWLLSLLLSGATANRSPQHVGKRESARPLPAYLHQRRSQQLDSRLSMSSVEGRALDLRSQPLFLTEKTRKFAVNGTGIPDVDFDVGESYAGQLPISNKTDEENNLFFWFFPSQNPLAKKEIMIWLNGGPGCSSFAGLLQENGPFMWQIGTFRPVKNPYSWTELTNVIWIEQPVGTGFATGTPTAKSEEDVASQFLGFWRNFIDTFDMHGFKVYITGESYAGAYCPYIANAMITANETDYFDMKGMLLYDPVIGEDPLQEQIPILAMVEAWPGVFPFNDTFRADLRARDAKCGLTEYMNKGLSYPPTGPLPDELPDAQDTACMRIFDDIWSATIEINPCFNIYDISQGCPILWDVLGFPGSFDYIPEGATVYFDRADVKAAIHAPAEVEWRACADNIFVDGYDLSEPSSHDVLPKVIDHTQNVIIGHGSLDMVLVANGTLLAIQNMTWGGKLGFQSRPADPFFVPRHAQDFSTPRGIAVLAASGVMGVTHTERGLTYVGIEMSGHAVPQYQPTAAFRHVEVLLGRVANLSSTEPLSIGKNYSQPAPGELGGPPSTPNFPPESKSSNGTPKSESSHSASTLSAFLPLVMNTLTTDNPVWKAILCPLYLMFPM